MEIYLLFKGHPRFLNQLSQGLDIVSLAGEWLAATANTNMFTYEIAPVFIMMEHEVRFIERNTTKKQILTFLGFVFIMRKTESRISISQMSMAGRPDLEVPELSYGINSRMPSASVGIDLRFAPERGRFFVATQDLLPGNN